MVRVLLLLLMVGALVIFGLQNLSPIPLVILGMQTLALPLAFWVLSAIVAGAFTTLVLAGLSNVSRPVVSARPAAKRSADRVAGSSRSPWNTWTKPKESAKEPKSSRYAANDWETGGQTREEWDDWDDYQEPANRKTISDPNIRDTEDDDWARWEGYEGRTDRRREEFEDEFETEEPADRPSRSRPRRTDFEAQQELETRRQSGSVYSYSYRKSNETSSDPEPPPVAKPSEVYDADYRVITPPYRPDPEEVIPPPSPVEPGEPNDQNDRSNDENDWGLDEDDVADQPDDKGKR
ncbi:MAG: hypothetical protein HC769_21400 [Cyanobacteria bacterium CRU_2_1]|nr:hypothetical protein [Cyanobacteria bacterium RU_5_0]NJR61155.1 hypothetical protein [Cyanobacteria bacterium CRU_2_1]